MFLVSPCSCLRSIHWSHVLSWEWRCSWSSAARRCSNYIWVINNVIAYWGATYIRGFTVISVIPLKFRWFFYEIYVYGTVYNKWNTRNDYALRISLPFYYYTFSTELALYFYNGRIHAFKNYKGCILLQLCLGFSGLLLLMVINVISFDLFSFDFRVEVNI